MKLVDSDEYKRIILSILVCVDKICKENNLKYSISYGTLLGAVRHKGFIPWDDDIDIVMPLDDFYKLIPIINDGNYGVKLWWCENNKDICFPFGKLCATNTLIKEGNMKQIDGYGAYVDVFPLLKIPDKKRPKRWNIMNRMCSYSQLTKYTASSSGVVTMVRACEFYISRLINGNKCARRIVKRGEKITRSVEKKQINYRLESYWDKKSKFPKDLFDDQVEVEFEGFLFCGSNDPDKILSMQYGDYMTLPPKEKQVPHHFIECWINEEPNRLSLK